MCIRDRHKVLRQGYIPRTEDKDYMLVFSYFCCTFPSKARLTNGQTQALFISYFFIYLWGKQ